MGYQDGVVEYDLGPGIRALRWRIIEAVFIRRGNWAEKKAAI